MTTTVEPKHDHASSLLQDVIRCNRNGEKLGVYAVCSAHPSVIDAAIRQSIENGSVLLVESTSSLAGSSARGVLHSEANDGPFHGATDRAAGNSLRRSRGTATRGLIPEMKSSYSTPLR